jgi:hypothetical protein
MSALAFVHYARFKTATGANTSFAYQNFSVNQTRNYSGVTYQFVPFAVSTGAGSKGGDRSEAALAAGANEITVNIFAEAVESRWFLEIKTVSLNPVTFADDSLIRTELWRVARYELDTNRIVIRLNSPLDAIRDQVPKRYLSSKLVGSLPSTGNLTLT